MIKLKINFSCLPQSKTHHLPPYFISSIASNKGSILTGLTVPLRKSELVRAPGSSESLVAAPWVLTGWGLSSIFDLN